MKKTLMSIAGLAFFLFIGTSAFGQESSIEEIKPLTFKTQADLDAWITANPNEYARLKTEAEQISATYIGQLLIVGTKPEVEQKEVQSTINEKPSTVKTSEPVKQGKAPAKVKTPVNLEGFPVMENTGDTQADQKRYEEAKKAWYEQNDK